MYGTVARLQIRPGSEPQLLALSEEYAATTVPGYVGEYVYRMDNEPNTYYMAVIFENREAYRANADSPDQHARFLKFRELLASEPEWHDGEIIATPR